MLQQISNFYERYENIGLRITFVLVSLQVIHLFWLTTFVILQAPELTLYVPPILFVIIDYIEIPALVSGVVFYSLSFAARKKMKDILFISLLLIQAVHIGWITDAFIYMSFKFGEMTYLAWVAVFIDFLELTILYDLYKRLRGK